MQAQIYARHVPATEQACMLLALSANACNAHQVLY